MRLARYDVSPLAEAKSQAPLFPSRAIVLNLQLLISIPSSRGQVCFLQAPGLGTSTMHILGPDWERWCVRTGPHWSEAGETDHGSGAGSCAG